MFLLFNSLLVVIKTKDLYSSSISHIFKMTLFTPSFIDDFVFDCLNAGKKQGEIVDDFMTKHSYPYEDYLKNHSREAVYIFSQKSEMLGIQNLKLDYLDALKDLGIDIDKETQGKSLGERIMQTKVSMGFISSNSIAINSEDAINLGCGQILNKISLAGGVSENDFVDFFYAAFFHEMSHKLDDYMGLIRYSEYDSPEDRWHKMTKRKEMFAEGMTKIMMASFGRNYDGWKQAYEADAVKLTQRESFQVQIAKTIGHGFSYGGIFQRVEETHPSVRVRCETRARIYESFGGGFKPYLNPNTKLEIKEILAVA